MLERSREIPVTSSTRLYFIAAVLFSIAIMSSPATQAIAQDDNAPTILITGANRGIGFEFARQYAEKYWNVIATCRDPDAAVELRSLAERRPNVVVEQLDVTDHAMIDALAEKLEGQAIDVLLNNAAIVGGSPDQFFGQIDHRRFDSFMQTNALGPLKMAEAFYQHVKASQQKKIANLSSLVGSTAYKGGRMPGAYFYKGSKAALDIFMFTLAGDVKKDGITVVLLGPGIVNTGRLRSGSIPGIVDIEKSVGGLIAVIERLTLDDTGKYFRHTGEEAAY